MERKIGNRGQVALVALLVSAVVMTLGLSVSRRAVVETQVDTNEEMLKQAFNTAESGIEYYLGTGETLFRGVDGSRAEIGVVTVGETNELGSAEVVRMANETVIFWLMGHLTDGSLDVGSTYSGATVDLCVDGTSGGVAIDYYYKVGSSYLVNRKGVNLAGSGGVAGFEAAGSDTCSNGWRKITVNTGNMPLLLTAKMIGGNSRMVLQGSSSFPVQGEKVSSIGRVGTAAVSGGINTRVEIENLYQVPDFMFEAASAGDSVLSQ